MLERAREHPLAGLTGALEDAREGQQPLLGAVIEALTGSLSEVNLHDLAIALADRERSERDAARDAHLQAARAAAAGGDLLTARQEAETAVHGNFTDVEAHRTLAEILEELGDDDGAYTHYTLALHFGADIPEVREAVARTHERCAGTPDARLSRRYERAVERAVDWLERRDLRRAEACARMAIVTDGQRPEAFNLLGVVRELEGNRTDAQLQYRMALELLPGYPPAAENLTRSTGPREARSRPSW